MMDITQLYKSEGTEDITALWGSGVQGLSGGQAIYE